MNRLSRRTIALIAAYAVALQALLPLSLAVTSAFGSDICASASAKAPQPDRHDGFPCCSIGCAMACCAGAVPVSTPDNHIERTSRPAVTPQAALRLRFAATGQRNPQLPRAPPVS